VFMEKVRMNLYYELIEEGAYDREIRIDRLVSI